ncbi:MAG: porin family protein [Bacteroides sp.]|nr:porin family protein [Bacteroides sp.]
MKRRLLLLYICICIASPTLWGQDFAVPGVTPAAEEVKAKASRYDRPVNFGIKGGFTSSLFLIQHLTVNGVSIDEVQNNYKIGYFASIFMRINFGRHFLQPEVSYNINRCNITFDKPLAEDAAVDAVPEEASITSSIHSIDIPVIYGYNFIKEGPYSLAVFGGPKIRYILPHQTSVTFDNFDQTDIHESLYNLNVSATVGVAVTISRIFFDFRYDIGLHNISKRIAYGISSDDTETAVGNGIRFQRRDNVLSFSFGVFF